jgi:hypothetical protein
MESKTYSGRIAVGDDSPLEVALHVTPDHLQVAAGEVDIGTWPIADCTIRANGNGDFALEVDGDTIHFNPDDRGDFAAMVASIEHGTLSGFLSGGAGSDAPAPEAAPKRAPRKSRAAKPKQSPPSTGALDVPESTPADSEPEPAPAEMAVEPTPPVEEMTDRVPKHKKPRSAPKGRTGQTRRVVVDEVDQLDLPVEVEPEASGQTSLEIEPGPEPDQFESTPIESLQAPPVGPGPEADGMPVWGGGDEEIDPGPEPPPWNPPAAEPVEEAEAVVQAPLETGSGDAAAPEHDQTAPEDEQAAGEGSATESLTDRIMAMGGDPDELRRNFGQRLGRRRIAPAPPVAGGDAEDGQAEELSEQTSVPEEPIGTDAGSLAAAVEALRRQSDDEGEAVTVADAILASQRTLRESSTKPSRLPGFLKRFAILAGAVLLLGGLGLGGVLAFRVLTQDADPTDSTTAQPDSSVDGSQPTPTTTPVVTTAPPTTVAGPETTIAVFQPTAFALSAPEFVKRWNETASSLNPQLALPSLLPGEFEFQLTPYLAVAGTVGASGSVDTITMTIDPTGPSEADAIGLQAMGLMIAVADPNLDGPGRKDLLASMGLDVSKPVLIGLDSATARGGVAYNLFYDEAAQRLFFTAAAG